jgi:hypothetical protein
MDYNMRREMTARFLDDVKETLDRKGNDYASESNPFSNFTNTALITKQPTEKVFISEMVKKCSRMIELLDKPAACESMYDSLRDIAGYACLMDNYLRGIANDNGGDKET